MQSIEGRTHPYPFCGAAVRILIVFALVMSMRAFGKDKDKEHNSDVKFRARTELVLVPTLVIDKSGAHITGLKKEDFTVLENGSERNIATFEEITTDANRPSRPKNPNEFTNSVNTSGSAHRITLIVLDLANTNFTDQAYARQELLRYLTQSLDEREPTALFTLTRRGLEVVHDFTTDPRILIAALRKMQGDTSNLVNTSADWVQSTAGATPQSALEVALGSVQAEATDVEARMKDAELRFQAFEQRLAIIDTLEGMQAAAQVVAGLPGRKALIWAGGGFPFSVADDKMDLAPAGRDSLADVVPLYERTWQVLNESQIAVYPVDVKGLQGNVADATIGIRGSLGLKRGANLQAASWSDMEIKATLEAFAVATGGRAYFNSNDLVKGFRDAVRDASEYYILGYYLDQSNTKPGWRKLAVKVKRDHAEVRTRGGFFVTNTTVDPAASRNVDLAAALQSPVDYSALPLFVRWDTTDAGKDPGMRHVRYVVDLAPDPSLIDTADNNHVLLDFYAVAKTLDGKQFGHPTGQTMTLHPTAEQLVTIRERGIGYHSAIDLPPGDYTVRIVVRDGITGRVGSVAAPLKVQ